MSSRRLLSAAVLLAASLAASLAAAASARAATAPAAAAAAAWQADVIRGRVIGPDSQPIENVTVTATSISGNVNRTARTDKNGRFTITFPGGDGDYMLTYAAVGFAARRMQVKRVADEDVLIADAKLQRVGAVLDPVRVAAQRDRPNRNEPIPPDVGGTEQRVDPGAVPAFALGDLAAMAASLPGLMGIPGEDGGYSAFGLGADQNNTTLNGMSFGGNNLPRDAAVSTSVATSPYDVARGGFSGAQMNIRTQPGTNFRRRGLSMFLDAPQMQWTDAAARALGQEYTNASVGGIVSGPLVFDKAFYNVSFQLGRQSNDLQTLLNTDPVGLQAAGVSADSVSRLLSLLQSASIPPTVGGIPGSRLSDRGSVFGSFDVMPPSSSTGQAFNVAVNASWNRQTPVTGGGGGLGGFGPGAFVVGGTGGGGLSTELPSHGGERTSWNASVQARHNNYFKQFILSETSFGISSARNWAEPYLTLPDGRVRVNSTFDDGTSGVQMLSFGGNQNLRSSSTNTVAGFMNQLSWFSMNNKHRLKLTSELRHERSAQELATNLYGTFSYNSLADLQANRPASFSRQLSPRRRDAGQLVGAVSLGDSYRPTQDLQIQYGLRVDANRFLDAPAANPEVARAFGRPNDVVPDGVYLSPRVGFSWTYGTAAQIGAFEGAFRGPRAVVRGGVGVFQNVPGTGLVGSALDNTGLPSAVQQLSCVGPATPIPDWELYGTDPSRVPDRCADGTTGTVFANAAPNVSLFAKDWTPSRSIRSNLQWNGPVLGNRLSLTVDGTYSHNLNQSSFVDLNFAPTQRFTLAEEGGRPVYVQPTSIVPTTGAIASRDARVSPLFSRVTEQRSDLTSRSAQLRLGVAPVRFSSSLFWNASYVLSNFREQYRGFQSTAGDPLAVAWGRSTFDARHQITYTIGYNFFDFVRVSWFGRFQSGTPFTPTIGGDVNGDGYVNDRAFVFDPSSASDPAVAEGMRSLLAGGSDAARECLRKQLGRLADRNSCEGPWTSFATLSLTFNPLKVRMPQRASLSFQISNPLGAADLLLHGERNLRGWGQSAFPDQALLHVRGFDPQTRRYRYEVNQRFGATNPQASAFRAPVTLTAMLRVDIAPTRERQLLTQQLDRGRRTNGTKAPEMLLRAMYGQGGIQNPMAQILRQQDSLELSAAQADSLASMNRRYLVRLDSIWSPLTAEWAKLPDDFDHDEVYDRYRSARRASIDMLIQLAPAVRGLLTAEQYRKLPPFVASFLDTRYLASIRSGTAGSGMGGGPMMMGGAVPAMVGGGNVQIIQVR